MQNDVHVVGTRPAILMLTAEDKLGAGMIAIGWALLIITAPLAVMPMLWMIGLPGSAVALMALLTGLLFARHEDARPTVAAIGGTFLFFGVALLIAGLFETLQLTGAALLARQRGQFPNPPNSVLTRIAAEAALAAAFTALGLLMRPRWSPLAATAMGFLLAMAIPAVGGVLILLVRAGMPLAA